MIVVEAIVTCRWPLVALAYVLPETMWSRVESAYIFHHKYPIPVFHDKINGNHEAHSSMEAPKSENDVVKLTVPLFIVHNGKGFPLLWLIKCSDWCDPMPCRRIVYELESIQLDMDWWHACIITIVNVFFSFWLKMDEDLFDVTRCCGAFLWHQAIYSGRIRFLISQM